MSQGMKFDKTNQIRHYWKDTAISIILLTIKVNLISRFCLIPIHVLTSFKSQYFRINGAKKISINRQPKGDSVSNHLVGNHSLHITDTFDKA